LATDNLANLIPHPLYAWFYYSHPPLIERIKRLKMDNPPSSPFTKGGIVSPPFNTCLR
jgi:hypothetical protein